MLLVPYGIFCVFSLQRQSFISLSNASGHLSQNIRFFLLYSLSYFSFYQQKLLMHIILVQFFINFLLNLILLLQESSTFLQVIFSNTQSFIEFLIIKCSALASSQLLRSCRFILRQDTQGIPISATAYMTTMISTSSLNFQAQPLS